LKEFEGLVVLVLRKTSQRFQELRHAFAGFDRCAATADQGSILTPLDGEFSNVGLFCYQ